MSNPGDPTAVVGRRVIAYLIDLVIYGAAFAVPFFILAESATVERLAGDSDIEVKMINGITTVRAGDTVYALSSDDRALVYGIGLGVAILMFWIIQGLTGWTIGKLLVGIRTVKPDGSACGIGRAIVRTLLWIVDAIPYILIAPLVGFITAMVSTGHKRVGDMVAGTFVVKRSAKGSPIDPTGAAAAAGAATWDPNAAAWESPPPNTGGTAAVTGAAPAASGPAPTYEPQWDAARGAYLQWDPRRQQWLQYDDTAKEWKPIS